MSDPAWQVQAKLARQCSTQPPSEMLREVRNLSESTSRPTLCPIDYQQVLHRCSGFSIANCRPLSRDGALVPFADPLGSSDLNTVPRNLSVPPASIRKWHSRGSNPGPCECKTATLLTELRALDYFYILPLDARLGKLTCPPGSGIHHPSLLPQASLLCLRVQTLQPLGCNSPVVC